MLANLKLLKPITYSNGIYHFEIAIDDDEIICDFDEANFDEFLHAYADDIAKRYANAMHAFIAQV